MASSGLRKRGAGGAGVGASDGERTDSPATPSGEGSRLGGGESGSYTTSENGHKIAFDPRDISESAERSKQPKLTLMEEVLLLGLKDKQVRLHLDPSQAYLNTFRFSSMPLLNFFCQSRDTYPFGTTIYHMLYVAALFLNLLSEEE